MQFSAKTSINNDLEKGKDRCPLKDISRSSGSPIVLDATSSNANDATKLEYDAGDDARIPEHDERFRFTCCQNNGVPKYHHAELKH